MGTAAPPHAPGVVPASGGRGIPPGWPGTNLRMSATRLWRSMACARAAARPAPTSPARRIRDAAASATREPRPLRSSPSSRRPRRPPRPLVCSKGCWRCIRRSRRGSGTSLSLRRRREAPAGTPRVPHFPHLSRIPTPGLYWCVCRLLRQSKKLIDSYAPTLAGSTQSRSIPSYTYGSRSVGTAHSSRSVRSGATYGRQPSSGKSVAASCVLASARSRARLA